MPPGDFTPQEQGFVGQQPRAASQYGLPPGDGKLVLPHFASFVGLTNYAYRNYRQLYDECLLDSRENARRMKLDPVIRPSLRLRMLPTAMLTGHVEPDDEESPEEIEAADFVTKIIQREPQYVQKRMWLLDAIYTGRSGVQQRYQWVARKGRQYVQPTLAKHVHGDKLVFMLDGRPAILVNSAYGMDGNTIQTDMGRAYLLSPEEREQLMIHSFEPEDADYYDPQMAGMIFGHGLRSQLYWLWALKSRIWALGVDFLEWFCQGLTIYYFEHGNDEHKKEVKEYIEAQSGSRAIMFPRMKDGSGAHTPVERIEPNSTNAQFIQSLLTGYFDELIRQAILGQTLTSGTAATGLGSGVAAAHQNTFENIVKYDATSLDETYTNDEVKVIYRYTFPHLPPGRWRSEVDSPNVQQMIENAQAIVQMGGAVDGDALLQTAGLPPAKPGGTVLSNVQPMQPSAVNPAPEGVPIVDGSQVSGQG